MNAPGRYPAILDRLERGAPLELSPVGGGCIADSRIATFADGSSVFVKCAAAAPDLFPREAEGLAALAEAGAIRVPGCWPWTARRWSWSASGRGRENPAFSNRSGGILHACTAFTDRPAGSGTTITWARHHS